MKTINIPDVCVFVCATGIVYVFSQKDAESVSSELQKQDIVAYPYHANMDPDAKSRVHRKWASNKIKVFSTYDVVFLRGERDYWVKNMFL